MPAQSKAPVSVDRQRDAKRTKAEILEVATREFARQGYAGARVDQIAALTNTTKRMIYYYFGSKEKLYIEVLEKTYYDVWGSNEAVFDVEKLPPIEAIRTLAELHFDYLDANEDYIKLVSAENIHGAAFMRKSPTLVNLATPVLELIERLLQAGRDRGDFVTPADAADVHLMITAFSFYRISNRHTWKVAFGRDLAAPEARTRHREIVGDMVIAYLTGAKG